MGTKRRTGDPEAYPLLSSGLSRLYHGLLRVLQSLLHVIVDLSRLRLDRGDRLVLLLDEHAHLEADSQ